MSITLPRTFYFLPEFATLKNLSLADLEHQIEIGALIAAVILGRCQITPHPLDWNVVKMTPVYLHPEDSIGVIQNPDGYRLSKVFATLNDVVLASTFDPAVIAPILEQMNAAEAGIAPYPDFVDFGRIVSPVCIIAPAAALVITPDAWRAFERQHPDLFPTVEKPLHESERTTLLRIIRALADLHGVGPIKTRKTGDGWYKAAEAMLADLGTKGITPPVKDAQTLAEKLREAFSLRE